MEILLRPAGGSALATPLCVGGLEKLIGDVKDPSLKHRIYQAGFRGMVKRLKGSALKEAFQSERLILKAPL
jgi:hypothetical protein